MTPLWLHTWPWVGRIAAPLAIFAALMALGALLLLNPLVISLVQALVAVRGEPFAGNFELISFFLSPVGFLTLLLTGCTAILLAALEFGGLTLIAWDGLQRRPIRLIRIWHRLAARLPSLAVLTAVVFSAALLLLLPIGAAAYGAYKIWLTGGDIYFYVSTRPREFYLAAGFVGAIGVICVSAAVFLALRWFLAVPFCVLEGMSASKSLRTSAAAMPGRKRELALGLVGWFAVSSLLSMFAVAMFTALKGLMPDPGSQIEAVSRTILILYVSGAILIAAVSGLSRALLAIIAVRLYAETGSASATGASVAELRESRTARWRFSAAAYLALPVLVGGQVFWALDSFDLDRPVAVTAHRAGSLAAPENSLSALERAVADGADFAEIDVQETQDGEVVVLHDTDLRRVANLSKSIWEVRYEDIRELDAGSWFGPEFRDERIPSLREFALAAKGRIRLNVELKVNGHGVDLAGRTLAILRETGVWETTMVSSLNLAALARVRAIDPNMPIGFIASAGVGNLAALDVDFYSLARRVATPATIRRLGRTGREVHVWGLETESAIIDAVLNGADNVITDNPALARRTVKAVLDMTAAEVALLRLQRAFKGQGFRLF